MSQEHPVVDSQVEAPSRGSDPGTARREKAPVAPSRPPGGQRRGDRRGDRRGGRPRRRAGQAGWRTDRPLVVALAGFYTGLAMVVVVPTLFGVLLAAFFDRQRAEELLPLVLVPFLVPLVLLVPARTRRFAAYAWIGIVSTAVVVGAVGALVVWFMLRQAR